MTRFRLRKTNTSISGLVASTMDFIFFIRQQQKFFQLSDMIPSKEGTLADNQVNCIYIDRSGIVWIGTNGGISIYDPVQQKFAQTFLPAVNNAVKRFMIFIPMKTTTF